MMSSNSNSPFRVELLSDIHLEHNQGHGTSLYQYDFPVMADDLALLGDIGNTKDDGLFEWLDLQLMRFRRVFFVAGNHEPYGSTLDESHKRLSDYAAMRHEPGEGRGVFVYLYRTRYDLSPTLTLLGCTLWSALDPQHVQAIASFSPDFKYTKSFSASDYDRAHQTDLAWLEESIISLRTNDPERQIVVFTHHSPTDADTQDPKFKGGIAGSAFATELTEREWWGPPIRAWCFGHTHWTCEFMRQGVRVLSNQRGYPTDGRCGFEEGKVVEL